MVSQKLGYEVDDTLGIAFWNDDTRRATKLERDGCKWYKFVQKPIEQEQEQQIIQ